MAARDHRFEQEATERLERRQEALKALLPQLDDAPDRWWEAVGLLADPLASPGSDDVFGQDLTLRPGWAWLSSTQQQHLLDAGLRYLDSHQPRVCEW